MAIVVPILSKYDPQGVRQAQRSLDDFGRGVSDFAKKAAVGIGIAVAGLGAFAASSIKAAEQASTDNARIRQITESMGLYGDQIGAVNKQLDEYAKTTARQTGVDLTVIKQTQAKLLTFQDLAVSAGQVNGAFERATAAAVDLAAAGFGEAEQNAVQLGKALQDPIKGITALARSGVTFTDVEKDMIAELVRANRTAEAQDLVLKSIERQVGGTARATANASDKMRVSFEQIKVAVGEALLPLFDRLTNFVVNRLVPAFERWWAENGPKVIEFLSKLADWLGRIITVYLPLFIQYVTTLYNGIANWWSEQETLQGWLDKFGTWLEENPDKVLKLAAALLAVYAAIKLLAVITAFVSAIQALATWGSAAASAIGAITAALGGAGVLITTIGVGIGVIGGFILATDKLVAGWRTLRDLVDAVIGKILYGGGFSLGDLLPGPGSLIPSRPSGGILPFANGGIVTSPTIGLIGEAGPEAVIPLDQMGAMGGVNVTVNGALDPVAVANQINRILQQRGYRNGALT